MNDFIKTLEETRDNVGLKCWGEFDASQLIEIAELAARKQLAAISTTSKYVHMLWSWVEKTKIEIYAKIQEDIKKQTQEEYGERLSEKINSVFKSGAAGVQIFIDKEDLDFLVSALYPVKDDLFFGKKLFLGLSISKIEPFDWEDIFYRANKIGASGILFEKDVSNKKKKDVDDTIGRLYGLFDFVNSSFFGQIHFSGFNISEIESAVRLCQKMRPELASRLVFFLEHDFYKFA